MTEAEAAVVPATLGEALLAVQVAVGKLELTRTAEGKIEGQSKAGGRFSYNYKYLPYGELLDKVRPVMAANGLVWQTFPTTSDGKPALRYRLTHTPTGETQEDVMLLMMDKQTSQAQGSAITYARRQALMAALEITPDEDDDGAQASQPARPEPLDPEKPLSERSRNAMLEAVAEAGLVAADLLREAGHEGGDAPVLVSHGLKVKEILAARAGS